jgi:hypothetical protein
MVNKINNLDCSSAVQAKMFSYVRDALNNASKQYSCSVNSDFDWVRFGISRVLHRHGSGREFFQDLRMESMGKLNIKRHDFQEGLKSKRRLAHLTSVNENYLRKRSQDSFKQKEGNLPKSLDGFHIYAADGHFHAASCHDARDAKGRKNAIGHLYSMNLRNRDLSHLALSSDGHRDKPHDMGVIKRMDVTGLRQGASKGQKLLYIWDRAGIDFLAWRKWKHNNGIYFLSRSKANMTKEVMGNIPFDRNSSENSGVIANQYIGAGEVIRMVTYNDIELNETFEFITNLPHSIEPGVIAQLYRMRWDIEKVFDDVKNKLEEHKSWAKSHTAKRMQAQFIVVAYNLLMALRQEIEEKERLHEKSIQVKADKRWEETCEVYRRMKRPIPLWLGKLRRITQVSVKFIRWARAMFIRPSSWRQSIDLLAYEYAQN